MALRPDQQADVLALIASYSQAPETALAAPDIQQGELYWALAEKAPGSGKGVLHPQLVLQDDLFNRSRVETVIVCALTSNLKRVSEPGNLLLPAGEGNLPKASVVVVSQLASVPKASLGDFIGSLSPERVSQVLEGIRFQQRAFFGP